MNNRVKGSVYEEAAASFLVSEKYEILERNYRRKTGEIDLIARDSKEDRIVFIEVKYRAKNRTGDPAEAVNRNKQNRIYRTAEWYLAEKRLSACTKCRFDVISVLNGEIRHIKNAFGGF
ncbi:MAG: YraN family protein [Lachnospiraceae bacterium]|nr:YraN family protein [Lachnospiraceae bacterium]